jgi:hypothetical protein
VVFLLLDLPLFILTTGQKHSNPFLAKADETNFSF